MPERRRLPVGLTLVLSLIVAAAFASSVQDVRVTDGNAAVHVVESFPSANGEAHVVNRLEVVPLASFAGKLRITEIRLRHLPNPPPGLVTCNLYVTVENLSTKSSRKVRVDSSLETASHPKVYASDDLNGPSSIAGKSQRTYVSGTFTIDRNAPVIYSVDVRWNTGSTRRTGQSLYCRP